MKGMSGVFNIKFILVFLCFFMFSCKKERISTPAVASLTVMNAVISGKSVRLGNNVTAVANNSSSQQVVMAGETELYVWPVGDSANPYYRSPKFYAEERGTYSLFVAGQAPNIKGIILEDNIPYHADSTCGIRFINLSPNSPPLNITLLSSPGTVEVSNLTYLQNTDFKIFPAKAANTGYTFQFRRASDNSLIATYSLPAPHPRFTNITLVLRGLVASSPMFAITRVNNDR